MRVTGGLVKNKKLESPDGKDVRPASDKTRQAVFNLLNHAAWADRELVQGKTVLDIFCGTGAYGIEALSHGASHCTFIDGNAASLSLTKRNVQSCGLDKSARFMQQKMPAKIQAPAPFDLVFIDPPYGLGLVVPTLDAIRPALSADCLVVIECENTLSLDRCAEYRLLDRRRYGVSTLVFLRNESAVNHDQ